MLRTNLPTFPIKIYFTEKEIVHKALLQAGDYHKGQAVTSEVTKNGYLQVRQTWYNNLILNKKMIVNFIKTIIKFSPAWSHIVRLCS